MTLQPATFAMVFIIVIASHSIDHVPPSTELAHVSDTSHFGIGAPLDRAGAALWS